MDDHTAQLDSLRESAVNRALSALLGDGVVATVTYVRARAVLTALAMDVQASATDMARMSLLDAETVAGILGITRQRVYVLAASRGLGWRVGRDWIFSPADLEAMRIRRPGRPPRRVQGS